MGNAVDKGTGFSFHVNRYVAGSETDMYKHGYAEFLYVSDGSLTEHVCGDKVHIKKGDVCFINSGCVHKESFEEDDTFVIRLEVSDEIIKKVGYRNKGYFYRIFTEKYNMTPAKFRKYIKEKEFTI